MQKQLFLSSLHAVIPSPFHVMTHIEISTARRGKWIRLGLWLVSTPVIWAQVRKLYSTVFWESTPVTHTQVGSPCSSIWFQFFAWIPVCVSYEIPSRQPSRRCRFLHAAFLNFQVLLPCAPVTPWAPYSNYLGICMSCCTVSPKRVGITSAFSSW